MSSQRVIDADVHRYVPSIRSLFPYLSEYWIETIDQTGFKGATDPTMSGCAKGPYVAETFPVVVEQEYVIVDTGRRGWGRRSRAIPKSVVATKGIA